MLILTSTSRKQKGGYLTARQLERMPKGPNGRNLCRRCATEVPRGRITFCSDACVHEWKLVNGLPSSFSITGPAT